VKEAWIGGEKRIKTKIGVCIKDSAARIQKEIAPENSKGWGISVENSPLN